MPLKSALRSFEFDDAIWIPSTDIQKWASLHLNYDVYARPSKNTVLVLGPTAGVLPFDKVQAGDYRVQVLGPDRNELAVSTFSAKVCD